MVLLIQMVKIRLVAIGLAVMKEQPEWAIMIGQTGSLPIIARGCSQQALINTGGDGLF